MTFPDTTFVDKQTVIEADWLNAVNDICATATGENAGFQVDRFSGNGTTVHFTLTHNAPSEDYLFVFINGVYQEKNTYSYNAGTQIITFSVAPPTGTGNVEVVSASTFVLSSADASTVTYEPPFVNSVATTVQNKLAQTVSVKDFGAVGDGVTDDYTALQNALNSGQLIYVPKGTYCTSQTLVFVNGSKLIGAGNWSGTQTTDEFTGNSVIKYTGVGGSTSCVIRMSKTEVGVDPNTIGTANGTLMNASLQNIVIDGNSTAAYGLYMARAWSNNNISYITVTGTTQHAFWAGRCWNGTPLNWCSFRNLGAGITLGINTFGWSSSNVDNSTCVGFIAGFSGATQSGTVVYQNVFNETTNQDKEYGIGTGSSRGLILINAEAYQCGGAGTYVSANARSLQFIGGGNEGNGKSSNNASTKSWDIWINSQVDMWNVTFDSYYLGLTPCIRLTGTASSRVETAPSFARMYANEIFADYTAYKLIDFNFDVILSGSSPAASQVVPQGFKFDHSSASLNSYEEGSWSPTLAGSTIAGNDWTYSINAGYYTKIGRMVFVNGRIVLTAKSTTATGSLIINNLPFTIKQANNANSTATFSRVLNTNTSIVSMTGSLADNSTNITFRIRTGASTSESTLALSDITDTFSIDFSAMYVAA